jgi:hypothetical protein
MKFSGQAAALHFLGLDELARKGRQPRLAGLGNFRRRARRQNIPPNLIQDFEPFGMLLQGLFGLLAFGNVAAHRLKLNQPTLHIKNRLVSPLLSAYISVGQNDLVFSGSERIISD